MAEDSTGRLQRGGTHQRGVHGGPHVGSHVDLPAGLHAGLHAGLRFGLAAVLVLAVAVAMAAAFIGVAGRPAASVNVVPASAPRPVAARAIDDTAAQDLVSRFALNVLLAPLMDDATPPRWTDVAMNHFCGPATRVEIDGKPLVPGSPVPATAFTVRWQMDECWPFEAAALDLSGTVDLLVFHEDNGLAAVVDAGRMSIAGAGGLGRLSRPFPATLSLAGAGSTP